MLNQRGLAHVVAGLLIVAPLGACGGSDELTVGSTCTEYLDQAAEERHDAAARLSVTARAEDPGNPFWGPEMDRRCNLNTDQTLAVAFRNADGSDDSASADPPSTEQADPEDFTPNQQRRVRECGLILDAMSEYESQFGERAQSYDDLENADLLISSAWDYLLQDGQLFDEQGRSISQANDCAIGH
jgi:hypothetical protein